MKPATRPAALLCLLVCAAVRLLGGPALAPLAPPVLWQRAEFRLTDAPVAAIDASLRELLGEDDWRTFGECCARDP